MPAGDTFFNMKPDGDPIFLYGENDFAKQTYEQLVKKGYPVKGYIDQKYSGVISDGEIVRLNIQNVEKLQRGGVERYIVIICLQNGLQHEKAAAQLHQVGISRLIYLPMQINQPIRTQETYRRIYRLLTQFRYERIGKIPVYDAEQQMPFLLIDRGESDMTFWCPMEYIHTSDAQMILKFMHGKPDTTIQKLLAYADVSIEQSEPYRQLFAWLMGKRQDADLYLDAMGRISKEERDRLLKDRKYLYEVYETAFKYNMEFFMDSPSCGIWNLQGYFNISDGMHRIWYLYSKGYRKMPVIVSMTDYQLFEQMAAEKK